MPLFRQKPWEPLPDPEHITEKEPLFVMRFTNEIFRSYAEYIETWERYRQRVWTCSATGRKNLTFEEALVSEQKAEQANKNFPEHFLLPLLLQVQHRQDSLEELVDGAHEHFQRHFFPEELVEYRPKGAASARKAKVLSIVKGLDGSDKYEIELLDSPKSSAPSNSKKAAAPAPAAVGSRQSQRRGSRSGPSQEEEVEEDRDEEKGKEKEGPLIVSGGLLSRKKAPLTKPAIRRMIKVATERDTYKGAPWLVREAYLKRFPEIPSELPQRLKKLLEERSMKKRKSAPSEEDKAKDSEAESSSANSNANKRPKIKPKPEDLDDLDVSPSSASKEPPRPWTSFTIAKEYVGDLLVVWNFLTAFCKVLKLAPFGFDDFGRAIAYEEGTTLLIEEVHVRLLKMLRSKKNLTSTSWFDALRNYFESVENELKREEEARGADGEGGSDGSGEDRSAGEEDQDSIAPEASKKKAHLGSDFTLIPRILKSLKKQKKYHKLSQKKKIAILRFLIDDALDTDAMRKALEDNLASLSELKKQHKEKEAELMRRLKEERRDDDKKKQVQSMEASMERQATKHSIRTSPLGLDRHRNRYWYFSQMPDRLFVETGDKEKHGDTWGYYSSVEELDALLGFLDVRGVREKALKAAVEKVYHQMSEAVRKRDRELAIQTQEVRRSTRIKDQEKTKEARSFLTYVNTYRLS